MLDQDAAECQVGSQHGGQHRLQPSKLDALDNIAVLPAVDTAGTLANKGLTSAASGYAGGEGSTAQYELVSSGSTGHAESLQVTFDPRGISYGRIL